MEKTLKTLAKEAKLRMKKGFWKECEEELKSERLHAKENGINESKMERYFTEKVTTKIRGESPDGFLFKSPRYAPFRGRGLRRDRAADR